jgi:hypothetical protein
MIFPLSSYFSFSFFRRGKKNLSPLLCSAATLHLGSANCTLCGIEGETAVRREGKYPSYQSRGQGIVGTYVVISGSLRVHSLKISQVRILGRKENWLFYNMSDTSYENQIRKHACSSQPVEY